MAKSALISTVNTYNQGITHCPVGAGGADSVLYVVCFIVAVLFFKKEKRYFDSEIYLLAAAVGCSLFFGTFLLSMYRPGNTPSQIYRDTDGAIRYGCLHNATVIRLNPIFDDPKLFIKVYDEARGWYANSIVNAISLLQGLTIEYHTTGHYTL